MHSVGHQSSRIMLGRAGSANTTRNEQQSGIYM